VDRHVDRLVKEGHALAAPDAEALERRLEQEPYDLDARARLLGYYGHRCQQERLAAPLNAKNVDSGSLPPCAAKFRHALWLFAHAPDAPLAAHPLTLIPRSNRAYYEAAQLWQQHVAGDAVNATLLDHALRFFERENHVRVEELLQRAELAYPGDPRWARRRLAMRVDELSCAWIKYRIGDVTGKELSGPAELVEIEGLLRDGGLEPRLALKLHEPAARFLFHFGDLAKARIHAQALVTVAAGIRDGVDGPQVHSGHVMLGRIALREGDVGEARARLALAGRTAGTTLADAPQMALANELLQRGERDAVLQYLLLCRAACDSYGTILERWIAELRDGLVPELVGFPFID
jgi:hypothetical protein